MSRANPSKSSRQRVLATIVFTDVVSYSALMQENESRTIALVERDLGRIRELCLKHAGQVISSTGDGVLMFFTTARDAMSFALEAQSGFARAAATMPAEQVLQHRIGIHLGDIAVGHTDALGDATNVAARILAEAEPGGICLSQTVYDVVKNGLGVKATYLGPRELKNIREAVPLYQILIDAAAGEFAPAGRGRQSGGTPTLYAAAAVLVIAIAAFAIWRFGPWGKGGEPAQVAAPPASPPAATTNPAAGTGGAPVMVVTPNGQPPQTPAPSEPGTTSRPIAVARVDDPPPVRPDVPVTPPPATVTPTPATIPAIAVTPPATVTPPTTVAVATPLPARTSDGSGTATLSPTTQPVAAAFFAHDGATVFALSADGRVLATGGRDGSVRTWNVMTAKELAKAAGIEAPVARLAMSDDGRRVAAAAAGGAGAGARLHVFDAASGAPFFAYPPKSQPVVASEHLSFTPDGKQIAYGPLRLTLPERADPDAYGSPRPLSPSAELSIATFNDDGSLLGARTPFATQVSVYRVNEMRLIGRVRGPVKNLAQHASFSPDGRRLALLDDDGLVQVADIATGKALFRVPADGPDRVIGDCFEMAPDGRLVALCRDAQDRSVLRTWDAEVKEQPGRVVTTAAGASVVAADAPRLSRDGATLAFFRRVSGVRMGVEVQLVKAESGK